MTNLNARWFIAAAAAATVAALAACHDDDNKGSPPTPTNTSFTAFATTAFNADANSTPVSLDGVTFDYDADDNPTAFDTLIMSGTY